MSVFEALASDLQRLDAVSRRRRLIPRTGTDFSSNDYLALAGDPALAHAVAEAVARGVPAGSGGSRLLRGNHAEHEALEAEAAHFFGSESALWFATGYTANSAIVSTLPQRGDLVVYDDLIHASVHEGLRLTRSETVAVPHNDITAFADAIAAWRGRGGTGRIWIAIESLYSMDGDRAPLADLAALADANDAVLIIDEAHATGVFGAGGRGLAAALEGRENVITLHTCGKAMGCEGALVCAPVVVTDFLVNRGRGFIFSTAPSPLMAAAVRTALRIIEAADDRRAKLAALITHAERLLGPHGALISGSQVMPVILGDDARTMRAAGAVQAAGFDVRGIRPPTVPAGTSRLRISLTLNATQDDVSALAAVLQDVLA